MQDRAPTTREPRRLVWDGPLRLTHGLLVLAFAGSYVTHELGPERFAWHCAFGYVTLVLVVVRILWGFVGTRHALFFNFLRGPLAALRYLRRWIRGELEPHAGHNPAGGWVVVALLLLLAAQAVTGLFANDDIANAGPLFGYVAQSTSNALTRWHHRLFNALLLLVTIHVAAVLAYRFLRGRNLVTPMITGAKPALEVADGEAIASSRWLLWIVLIAAASALLAWIVARAPAAELNVF